MVASWWSLYPPMLRSRLFEEAVARLWHDGLISGEMHLGTGEEAIVAGVVTQLRDDDAMALDHRGTSAMFLRGVDPALLLWELLGWPNGLCGGMGGHMHLYSRDHLAASSGIVGAAGPAAAGFALAAQVRQSDAVAVAFFGEGAMNQGMLLESLNLASTWRLPVLFVCKDDSWAITTPSERTRGGLLGDRARGLGVPAVVVDGADAMAVWTAAAAAIDRARRGHGPMFLHAHCVHVEGHFLGYPLLRLVRQPLREVSTIAGPLTRSLLRWHGAPWRERLAGLQEVLAAVWQTLRDPRRARAHDPVWRARQKLCSEPARLKALEDDVNQEINLLLARAMAEVPA